MAGFEQAHELMVAVGDLLDLAEVIEFESQARWELTTADGRTVDVAYDETTDRLVLETVVGLPASGARERMYEAMLIYNGSWRETGGARLALDEPGGTATLLFDIRASGLAVSDLQGILGNVLQVAGLWRDYLQRDTRSESMETLQPFMLQGFIRG
jgi:hypothetical protein